MLHAINTEEGMFKDVGHALHVAYLVISTEARQDCATRGALLQMMSYAPKLTEAQADWFEELRGTASQALNFKGLRSDEVRAQCALIISAVRSKLPTPEMHAIEARYTQTDFEDADGVRRYAFSAERAAAIRWLSDWLQPSINNLPVMALDCLIAKLYANHVKTKVNYRDLANSFNMSHTTFVRAGKKAKESILALERNAASRLEPYFIEHGIVRVTKKST